MVYPSTSVVKKSFVKVLLVFVMLNAVFVHYQASAEAAGGNEQLVYEDNFDAYASRSEMPSSSTQPIWWQFSAPATTSVTLEPYPSNPSNKYILITDSGTSSAYAKVNFPKLKSGFAYIEFDMKTVADTDPSYKHDYFGATLLSDQNENITQVQNSTAGNGYVYKMLQKNEAGQNVSTNMMPASSYVDGDWYKIKLEVDFTQKKVKSYTYDQTGAILLGTVDYEGFQVAEASSVASLRFISISAGRGAIGIDNLKVTAIPDENSSGPPANQNVTVNVYSILNDVSHSPLGVVSNHLFDSDLYHPNRQKTLSQSLQALGAGTVRFGEGEASDRYLWTGAPYPTAANSVLQPQLSYYYSTEHPLTTAEKALINPDGTYKETQDFNEFMGVVNETGVQPFVIVGLDAMKATDADWFKTKAQLKEAAVEWVRYANVINGWNVKYWEIGNEPFYSSQSGYIWTPQEYADVFNEFATAMKAVDPTIHVGVPVYDSFTWNSTVMPAVSSKADFVIVHLYGSANVSPLNTIVTHVNTYFKPEDRNRIQISITETSTYSSGAQMPNNMSRAALFATKIGKILQYDKVDYVHFWVTRKGLNNNPRDERSAIDENGNLLPMGKAIQVWNKFLRDQMVSTTGATDVSAFASYSPSSRELSVFFVNSNADPVPVQLNIQNYTTSANIETWVLKGTGAADTNPALAQVNPVQYEAGAASLSLDPYSVTVIALKPSVE
ncbi:hypothetical protein [Paenibacillus sp. RC67]|uniref:hypothetical protein n=1 Tax=Paenibacillus sp. RC67 TaxID=3039392 RepID=UPI0024ACB708|nr:hypothetical protein [Paenibacillus sp. RC67]